jgi:hypothetical protein
MMFNPEVNIRLGIALKIKNKRFPQRPNQIEQRAHDQIEHRAQNEHEPN